MCDTAKGTWDILPAGKIQGTHELSVAGGISDLWGEATVKDLAAPNRQNIPRASEEEMGCPGCTELLVNGGRQA